MEYPRTPAIEYELLNDNKTTGRKYFQQDVSFQSGLRSRSRCQICQMCQKREGRRCKRQEMPKPENHLGTASLLSVLRLRRLVFIRPIRLDLPPSRLFLPLHAQETNNNQDSELSYGEFHEYASALSCGHIPEHQVARPDPTCHLPVTFPFTARLNCGHMFDTWKTFSAVNKQLPFLSLDVSRAQRPQTFSHQAPRPSRASPHASACPSKSREDRIPNCGVPRFLLARLP